MIAELSMSTIEMAALLSKPSSAWTAACSELAVPVQCRPQRAVRQGMPGRCGVGFQPDRPLAGPPHRPEPVESERPLQERGRELERSHAVGERADLFRRLDDRQQAPGGVRVS